MAYRYITENNLYNKQNYMYSAYGGIHFLKEYVDSRREYMEKQGHLKDETVQYDTGKEDSNDVLRDLTDIWKKLEEGRPDRETMERVNAYAKSFEVRKRIYGKYDDGWKPAGNKEFENYGAYLSLAGCMANAYQYTGCLKYFNCLLKLDDTLLSIQDKLCMGEKKMLYRILRMELDAFYRLAGEHGISMEE